MVLFSGTQRDEPGFCGVFDEPGDDPDALRRRTVGLPARACAPAGAVGQAAAPPPARAGWGWA
ncbi:hypothetical protein PQR01_34730, partial [Paraburkholderia rhynchosiae]